MSATNIAATSPTAQEERSRNRTTWVALALLFPTIFGFVVFFAGPVLAGFVISFTKWDMLTDPVWVGLQNYKDLLQDPLMWKSLRNTLHYCVITMLSLFQAV